MDHNTQSKWGTFRFCLYVCPSHFALIGWWECEDYLYEMVSRGDTEISLLIRSPKTPELPKFQFSGGGRVFNFQGQGGGAVLCQVKNSKCQDLPKFQWGGGGGTLVLCQVKNSSQLSDLRFQRGALRRIWTKIYCLRSSVQKPACASQIVSHILRMWRLTRLSFKNFLPPRLAYFKAHWVLLTSINLLPENVLIISGTLSILTF